MAPTIVVNYLAVILAAAAGMAVGFLWYSPLVAGKAWMKEKGLNKEALEKAQSKMGPLYAMSFVAALLTAYVLSHVTSLSEAYYKYPRLSTGVISAFWMWLGFIMPVQLTSTIFGDKNWRLLAIDTGYQLVAVLTMGATVGLF